MLALVPLGASLCQASIAVSRIDYHGWPNAWQLSNGTVELVFVPQTGRIMSYRLVGGRNILWNNPSLAGKVVPLTDKEWANFGGDKVWPAPQSDWNWPPDPVLERGEPQVRATSDGLIVRGRASSGLLLERQINMSKSGSQVRILDRLTNVSAKSVEKSVWEVCQVDDPDFALLPVQIGPRAPKGWFSLGGSTESASFVAVRSDGTLRIQRDPRGGRKYGSGSGAGSVAAVKGGLKFTMGTPFVAGESYPDGGCGLEVFTSGDPLPYVELELLGPIRRLNPGQSTSIAVVWTIEQ